MSRFLPSLPGANFWAATTATASVVGAVYCLGEVHVASAKPNEWLLVVRNGQQHYASIGGRCFHKMTDQVVKFPSQLQRVAFTAQQVTQEMQGVEVKGFLCWSVYRPDNGPLKAYSNLGFSSGPEPVQANQNLGQLAESVIRAQVANSTIKDVLQKRTELRESVRSSIQDVAKGWGIWLETVEITDVHISSKQLFSDMQAPFRQANHLEAENIRLKTETEVSEIRLKTETAIKDKRATTAMETALHAARMQLKQQQEEEKVNEEREVIRLRAAAAIKEKTATSNMEVALHQAKMALQQQKEEEKLAKEKDLIQRERAEAAHQLKMLQLKNLETQENEKFENDMKRQQRVLDQESKMSERSFELARMRTAEGVYKTLPIRDVKLVNVGNDAGVEGLVSRFAAAVEQKDGK